MPAEWAALTVEKQRTETDSTLSFFRQASNCAGPCGIRWHRVEWLSAPSDALAFRRRGDGGLGCVLNAGDRPMTLPAGELILTSAPLVDGKLPPDAAAWLV